MGQHPRRAPGAWAVMPPFTVGTALSRPLAELSGWWLAIPLRVWARSHGLSAAAAVDAAAPALPGQVAPSASPSPLPLLPRRPGEGVAHR